MWASAVAKTRKPGLMSAAEYRDVIERHSLRHKDVGWMCGYGERHARAWGLDEYPVPMAVALLLRAFDRGRITAAWLAEQIGSEPPA